MQHGKPLSRPILVLAILQAGSLCVCFGSPLSPENEIAPATTVDASTPTVIAPATAVDASAQTVVRIRDRVLRPASAVPPLGFNHFGGAGGLNYALNNLISNAGNEPIYERNMFRVTKTDGKRFEIDGGGADWFSLWSSGFLSGAKVRVYRLVNQKGQPIKATDNLGHLNNEAAKKVIFVGKGQILPKNSLSFVDGGHIANKYSPIYPNAKLHPYISKAFDHRTVESGKRYFYRILALGPDNAQSPPSDEVSVVVRQGKHSSPVLLPAGDRDILPPVSVGVPWEWYIPMEGGKAPFRFRVFQLDGRTPFRSLGLRLQSNLRRISGTPKRRPSRGFIVELRDSNGLTATRPYLFGSPPSSEPTTTLTPPTGLRAESRNGVVHLSWEKSLSKGVIAYRIERSTAPLASQEGAFYLDNKSPKLLAGDYVVLEKKFINVDMNWVNPRVRGIGNPPHQANWKWNRQGDLSLSFDKHTGDLPQGMMGGESALKIVAGKEGGTMFQPTMAGAALKNDEWYGSLEVGQKFRWEGWIRAKNLRRGSVSLSFASGYRLLEKKPPLKKKWTKFRWDFVIPKENPDVWHFGPRITIDGPGQLWIDDMRVYQVDDTSGDNPRFSTPNFILEEIARSQPAQGRKGIHRVFVLDRNATMTGLLNWHANSQVRLDWETRVSASEDFTLPKVLEFDLLTGDSKENRVVPWLVLQHMLHSEQDWLNFIEWLAAPFNHKEHTKRDRPFAYLRTQQRGNSRPWVDEFKKVYIELGNETWHNGAVNDAWLGFAHRFEVNQGGIAYGLFTKYLMDVIKSSPYWKSQGLDKKIEFVLGASYDGAVEKLTLGSPWVSGYGETAILNNPSVHSLSHANYAGPKWETGDAQRGVFSTEGLQAALLAWETGLVQSQTNMAKAQRFLAKRGISYHLTAYEGGPGGYLIPGQGSPEQIEINEKYGKSLALAVGVLNTWLGSYTLGWTEQAFLGFEQGSHFRSHAMLDKGYLPSVAWLALSLRNRVGRGDLIDTNVLRAPKISFEGKPYDAITAYTMRDGNRWTVFVLSRSVKDTVAVALALPFTKAEKITLFRLTGDPSATNRRELTVRPEKLSVDTNSLTDGALTVEPSFGGIRPATILAYVFEGAK